MSTRDTAWPAGTPCWVDLDVDDVEKAAEFYATVFGWDIQAGAPEFGGYRMCVLGGRPVAGLGQKQAPDMPSVWTTYLASDDADTTAAAITSAGGTVLMPPMDVGRLGRMAVATDPAGAAFGIWQAKEHFGAALVNAPGAQSWNEQASGDFDSSRAFYTGVFGYTLTDMSGGGYRYATIDLNGQAVGGLGGLPDETPADVPAHWMTYFGVADTDATVDLVAHLGGTVVRSAWDTPFGRMATVTDNQGAQFSMVSMPEA